jgi:hypothetical protein
VTFGLASVHSELLVITEQRRAQAAASELVRKPADSQVPILAEWCVVEWRVHARSCDGWTLQDSTLGGRFCSTIFVVETARHYQHMLETGHSCCQNRPTASIIEDVLQGNFTVASSAVTSNSAARALAHPCSHHLGPGRRATPGTKSTFDFVNPSGALHPDLV